MSRLITRRRIAQITRFASTQLAVQVLGFAAGIVLVRAMAPLQYGHYTLTVSMVSIASLLSDLGLATAVMAIGGRFVGQRAPLGRLVADANALHRRLALWSIAVLVPCFAVMLARQHVAPWQVAALTALIAASALLAVRSGVVLSVVRLMGHVGLQQRVDLATGVARLAVLSIAAWFTLDATIACLVNLGAVTVGLLVLGRHVRVRVEVPAEAPGEYAAPLRAHLWKQGPNSVYYVLSTQISVWLVSLAGNAEHVAEVGALGRLGAMFSIVAAVSASLVFPYFARREQPAELASVFIGVNTFFAVSMALLVAAGLLFPAPILWVLGGPYEALGPELVWMIVASTLWTWGGTVYGIGCARGWVVPVGFSAAVGVATMLAAAGTVDVSTVRGSFMVSTATALSGAIVAVAYVGWRLRRFAHEHAEPASASASASPSISESVSVSVSVSASGPPSASVAP